jgi:hypothetical protein
MFNWWKKKLLLVEVGLLVGIVHDSINGSLQLLLLLLL